jgi:trk system potassium uptake protein TrkH
MPYSFAISPGRVVIVSMLSGLLLGTLLLACPWAQTVPIGWLDCLFTATSSLSVTGLLVLPLSAFSWWGHIVIMLLMQIGALGVITLTVFLLSLFTTLGLSTKSMTGEVLELHATQGQHLESLVMFIILITLTCEVVGFLGCFIGLYPYYTIGLAAFLALFQAVSAFCSTGLTLVPLQHFARGTLPLNLVLITTALLVFIGELGFVVWRDVALYVRTLYNRRRTVLSLHTRIVLTMTPAIILVLFFAIWLLEYNGYVTFIMEALFNAICLRSSGFTTLVPVAMHYSTILVIMVVSFIGSSPGSTGSGIRITTFTVFLAAIKATLLRRSQVEIKGRSIPNEQVFKAISIVTLSSAWVLLSAFLLLITESHHQPFDCLLEACSAFANLGLSRGLTPLLSVAGKCIVIMSMLVGRIGSLTLLLALKKTTKSSELYYPEERVMLS